MRQPNEWEGAFDDPESGKPLDQHLPSSSWTVPFVLEIREGALTIAKRGESRRREARPEPGLLESFAALADASDEEILRFAGKWGFLKLCRHGLPMRHEGRIAIGKDACVFTGKESLTAWRLYSRTAGLVLTIAARLLDGESGGVAEWAKLYPETIEAIDDVALWLRSEEERLASVFLDHRDVEEGRLFFRSMVTRSDPSALAYQRNELARFVSRWLELADVRPALRWGTPTSVEVEFEAVPASLFGALGVQLMAMLGRSNPPRRCDACGRFFSPARRPSTGKRRFCSRPECKREAVNAAKRDARARRAAGLAPRYGRSKQPLKEKATPAKKPKAKKTAARKKPLHTKGSSP